MQRPTEEELRMLLRLRTAVNVEELAGFFDRQRTYYANMCLKADKWEDTVKLQGAGLLLEELSKVLKDAPNQLAQLEAGKRG